MAGTCHHGYAGSLIRGMMAYYRVYGFVWEAISGSGLGFGTCCVLG